MNTTEDISITVITGRFAGQLITLEQGDSVTVGRGNGVDFQVDDLWLSRQHFRIEHDGLRWTLTDLESRHGTLVNDEKKSIVTLERDDIVFAGSTRFCVTFGSDRPAISNSSSSASDGIKNIIKTLASKRFACDATLGDSES